MFEPEPAGARHEGAIARAAAQLRLPDRAHVERWRGGCCTSLPYYIPYRADTRLSCVLLYPDYCGHGVGSATHMVHAACHGIVSPWIVCAAGRRGSARGPSCPACRQKWCRGYTRAYHLSTERCSGARTRGEVHRVRFVQALSMYMAWLCRHCTDSMLLHGL